MKSADLYDQVAQLHVENLSQGFLSTLGTRFLTLMYKAIDEGQGSFLLVEQHQDRVIGFVAGARGMRAIYRRMLRNPVALGFTLLPSLVHPSRIRRIVDILRYGNGQRAPSGLPDAELLSIAVAPEFRGKGCSEALYRRLVEKFTVAAEPGFKITVGAGLDAAHRFYRRMGASAVSQIEVHRGEASTVYVHRLPGPGAEVKTIVR